MTTANSSEQTAMSAEEIRAAIAKVDALHRKMTFLVPLTEAERHEHRSAKIGPKTLRTLANRLVAARENRDQLPPSFDLRKFERDAELTGVLNECLARVDQMRAALRDTLLAVGYRAVQAATAAYSYIKVSSTTAERLKRTVEKMAARSEVSTASGTEPSEVPKPAEPVVVPSEPVVLPGPSGDKAA